MNTNRVLSKIFASAQVIPINDSSRIVLISDCHRSDGSWADDLSRNQNVYYAALDYYFNMRIYVYRDRRRRRALEGLRLLQNRGSA